MRETARNMRRGRGQTLRISTLPSLGMELLPEALAGYLAHHSGVSSELHASHHDDVAAKIAKRETDMVICYTPPPDTLLTSTLLGTGEMVALCRETDFPDAPEPLTLASLQDRRLIATSESGPQGRMIAKELGRQGVEPEVVGASPTFCVHTAMPRARLGMRQSNRWHAIRFPIENRRERAMAIRVHHESRLEWRKIGDIPMGWMRDHLDPSELAGHLSFHEHGDSMSMQLMEMRLAPQTLIAPHSHDDGEILFVVEGSLHWGDKVLEAGGSLYIPAGTEYSFRIGSTPARLLNFRARVDHSFPPSTGTGKLAEQDHAR